MNDIMKKRIVRASLVALLVSMPACVTPALAAGTVLAGISNTATALNSAVSGGQGNSASGDYAPLQAVIRTPLPGNIPLQVVATIIPLPATGQRP